MRWLLILLMLAPAPGFAQTRPIQKKPLPIAQPTKWRIRTLAVEGNHLYAGPDVLSIAGLKPGDIAGKDEFDAAHDRLLATGAFATVGYKFDVLPDGSGSDASFQVTENEVLPVRFYDLGVPDADLEASLHTRDPLFSAAALAEVPEVIARWTKWIQDDLAARNLDNKIMGSIEPWPDQLAIVFRPTKNLPAVAAVSFEGGHVLSEGALRGAVTSAAIGAPYTEGNFRMILDAAIRPVYEARGYMRVTFPKVRAEPVTDVLGLHVFVTVSEGESYKFGKVEIPGAAIRTGDLANFSRVNEELERIRNARRRAGYLNVQVAADRDVHEAEKTVDVAARIDAGPLYVMGKLDIVGLDLTGEAEMRRIWSLKRGSPFDPDYPAQFLDRVRREGMFDNLGKTIPETKIDEKTHTVDVTLTFAVQPPTRRPSQ
jgi:outer membrane protein assembly factor BamA